ncbi:MAG: hypothetical protein K9K67_15900 [Bacteriovoracaceae bacterium]|nr:hypothetical protein [Bacteriovoracaceae bacterium]
MNIRLTCALLLFNFWTAASDFTNLCPQEIPIGNEILQSKTTKNNLKVSILTKEVAENIFDHISQMKEIPYKYVIDGCDVRAYLAAKDIYEKWNIQSFRINVESYPGLISETPYTAENWVEFSRHSVLALCVYDQDKKNVSPLIVDVAFFNQLIEPDKWLLKLEDGMSPRKEITYSSMYKLNPNERRMFSNKFIRQDLMCAEEVRARFMIEQERIEKGHLPYGVGRSKEVIRLDLCQ